MRVADEKLIKMNWGLTGHSKQSDTFGPINFLQTKHAHEHFGLIIHVDIKLVTVIISALLETIYCLDQEHMCIFVSSLRSWKY